METRRIGATAVVGLATGGLFLIALVVSPDGPARPAVEPPATTEAAAAPTSTSDPEAVTVVLGAENGSGRTGTATLRAVDAARVEVAIELAGPEPRDNIQPVQIHAAACQVYRVMNPSARNISHTARLAHVIDNRSSSVVDVPLERLTAGGASIAVHDLGPPFTRLVACGDIPASEPAVRPQ